MCHGRSPEKITLFMKYVVLGLPTIVYAPNPYSICTIHMHIWKNHSKIQKYLTWSLQNFGTLSNPLKVDNIRSTNCLRVYCLETTEPAVKYADISLSPEKIVNMDCDRFVWAPDCPSFWISLSLTIEKCSTFCANDMYCTYYNE